MFLLVLNRGLASRLTNATSMYIIKVLAACITMGRIQCDSFKEYI